MVRGVHQAIALRKESEDGTSKQLQCSQREVKKGGSFTLSQGPRQSAQHLIRAQWMFVD